MPGLIDRLHDDVEVIRLTREAAKAKDRLVSAAVHDDDEVTTAAAFYRVLVNQRARRIAYLVDGGD